MAGAMTFHGSAAAVTEAMENFLNKGFRKMRISQQKQANEGIGSKGDRHEPVDMNKMVADQASDRTRGTVAFGGPTSIMWMLGRDRTGSLPKEVKNAMDTPEGSTTEARIIQEVAHRVLQRSSDWDQT